MKSSKIMLMTLLMSALVGSVATVVGMNDNEVREQMLLRRAYHQENLGIKFVNIITALENAQRRDTHSEEIKSLLNKAKLMLDTVDEGKTNLSYIEEKWLPFLTREVNAAGVDLR